MQINKLALVLVLMWLLCSGNTLNWQGHGNFTTDNTSYIWNYLSTNIDPSWDTSLIKFGQNDNPLPLETLSQNLVDYLNSAWDEFWNVVFAYNTDKKNSDTIVYGYAFRSHWMWFNGYKFNDGYYMGIIIWKDYNCISKYGLSFYGTPTYTYGSAGLATAQGIMTSLKGKYTVDQIWTAAVAYSQAFESSSTFPNSAFSVVISQNSNIYFYGKGCMRDRFITNKNVGADWGTVAIIQMR